MLGKVTYAIDLRNRHLALTLLQNYILKEVYGDQCIASHSHLCMNVTKPLLT